MHYIQDISLSILALAGPAPVNPLPELTQEAGSLLQKLSGIMGTSPVAFQLAVAAAATVAALLLIGLMLISRRPSDGSYSGASSVFDRLDRLEISLRESANVSMSAELKGVIGYFKQEVSELRTLTTSLQQQLTGIEQEILAIRKGIAAAPSIPAPLAPTPEVVPTVRPRAGVGAPLIPKAFTRVSFTEPNSPES